MSIKNHLNQRLSAAMIAAGIPEDCQPTLALSARPQFGDYQANGAMAAAKRLGANPRALAQQIVDQLDLEGIAERIEIAGPGFINLHLSRTFIGEQLGLSADPVACERTANNVVIDYSSPNLAKEMHVGHIRSTIIGDCLARVLEYRGDRVIRQNHMGDWGTQFGMLIAELELHLGAGERGDLALNDLEKFYQQAKRHFDEDPDFADRARAYVVRLQSGDEHCLELWQQFITTSVAHNLEIYRRLNVGLSAEHVQPESTYNSQLEALVSKLTECGLAVDDQGAKVIFLDDLADKKGQPSAMIIRKSDGGFLYATTDLAALEYRAQTLAADRILYFIDARQALHMKQVFSAGRKAGLVAADVDLEHHAFGTMMGRDGKPFKTRDGGTVKLAGLIDEAEERAARLIREKNPNLDDRQVADIARKLGIGAIKYADLSKTRTTDYIFDWEAMLSFEGNTAPYLQYAYTRICSIFRRADVDRDAHAAPVIIGTDAEKSLALKLLQFDETIEQVAAECYPHVLCTYLYDLASAFMSFYECCPILKSDVRPEDRASRLQLSALSATTLARGLDLLGIEVMQQM